MLVKPVLELSRVISGLGGAERINFIGEEIEAQSRGATCPKSVRT